MQTGSHLKRRGGICYWRRKVPVGLVPRFDRREISISLGVHCPRVAAKLGRKLSAVSDDLFDMAEDDIRITRDELAVIARHWFRQIVEAAEQKYAAGESGSEQIDQGAGTGRTIRLPAC